MLLVVLRSMSSCHGPGEGCVHYKLQLAGLNEQVPIHMQSVLQQSKFFRLPMNCRRQGFRRRKRPRKWSHCADQEILALPWSRNGSASCIGFGWCRSDWCQSYCSQSPTEGQELVCLRAGRLWSRSLGSGLQQIQVQAWLGWNALGP